MATPFRRSGRRAPGRRPRVPGGHRTGLASGRSLPRDGSRGAQAGGQDASQRRSGQDRLSCHPLGQRSPRACGSRTSPPRATEAVWPARSTRAPRWPHGDSEPSATRGPPSSGARRARRSAQRPMAVAGLGRTPGTCARPRTMHSIAVIAAVVAREVLLGRAISPRAELAAAAADEGWISAAHAGMRVLTDQADSTTPLDIARFASNSSYRSGLVRSRNHPGTRGGHLCESSRRCPSSASRIPTITRPAEACASP